MAPVLMPLVLMAPVLLIAGCMDQQRPIGDSPTPGLIRFELLSDESAPSFVHFNGMSGRYYFAELFSPGVALFDYDRDGDLDLYVTQGRLLGEGASTNQALAPTARSTPLTDRLFRNDLEPDAPESLCFTDVTAESGIRATGYGMGVAVGDFDRDGWTDLYLTTLDRNQLWRNNGDSSFSEISAAAGVVDNGWSVPATFFDYDADGWLDLYIGNYVHFDPATAPVCEDLTGAPDYCGPNRFENREDRLLRNRGDGTFADVTASAGLAGNPQPALGSLAADLDRDGDLDLYIANDDQPNQLFVNNGDGTFTEQALLRGCGLNAAGEAEAGMGVDSGDYDADGDLDLFVVHLRQQTNTLYVNDGRANCDDRTSIARLAAASLPYTSFGAVWADFDRDGWLDLAVANGSIVRLPSLAERGDPFPLHQPNQVFRNLGIGRFDDITATAGPAFDLSEVSRGLAAGDLDNDGDPDLVVGNNNGPLRVMINRTDHTNHWLGVELVTNDSRADARGAVAELLRKGHPSLLREVHVDGSFASAGDPRLLFGLGEVDRTGTLRVRWTDGQIEEWTDLAADRYHRVVQGSGTDRSSNGPA